MIGLVYGYLPLMVFPLYVTLERMDRTLVEASKDLGAGRWATFRQITLPIALPGLITGSILVFIPMMGEYVIPQILGYGRTFLIGNALVPRLPRGAQLAAGAAKAVVLIALMLVTITVYLWFVNRGRAGPRGERPVSAPMHGPSHPAARGACAGRRGTHRVDRWAQLVEGWLPRPRDPRLRCSCTCRSSSSSCSPSTRTGSPTIWTGFSTDWFGGRAGRPDASRRPGATASSIAVANAILATLFGTMAALGLQRVGEGIRLGFDGLTYISIIVPEIVIALATLVFFAIGVRRRQPDPRSRSRAVTNAFKLGVRPLHDHRAPTCCSTRASCCCSSGPGCRGWTGRSSRPARTCSRRRGGRSARSRSRSCCRRSSRASCWRSRSASTTTSSRRSCPGPGSSTLPLFIFGQVKRGVTPETNAVAAMILAFTLDDPDRRSVAALAWSARRRGGGGIDDVIVADDLTSGVRRLHRSTTSTPGAVRPRRRRPA